MTARDDTVRAFVALPCPSGVRASFEETLPAWRELGGRIRWTPPGQLHLTLRFLGDSTPDQVARVRRGLRGVAGAARPLELRPTEVGAFPHWDRPRVLWLGFDGGEAVSELADAVETIVRDAGFEADDREFRLHLTLARVKGRRGVDRVVRAVREWRPEDRSEIVREMVLFRSELKPDGAHHAAIERFRLGDEG